MAQPAVPPVPLTIEGASVLHQMFRLRWSNWKSMPRLEQDQAVEELAEALSGMGPGTAAFSMLGHKGDLMFVHFRENFEELNRAEVQLARLRFSDLLEPMTSYLSVVELGLYESTAKTYASLVERDIVPHSPEWNSEIEQTLERQREAMRPRLWPEIPSAKYICFYPMDRRRGEDKNWYTVPMNERRRMMEEHGMVGRRYAGAVRQIITGSIGFDDWEWGVDLFAEDPLVFKRLIYEMRFDEVSAIYALFGAFYLGIRVRPGDLHALLNG